MLRIIRTIPVHQLQGCGQHNHWSGLSPMASEGTFLEQELQDRPHTHVCSLNVSILAVTAATRKWHG